MTDTADLTNLADLEEKTFFNKDYLSSALVFGLVLLPLMMANGVDYYMLL